MRPQQNRRMRGRGGGGNNNNNNSNRKGPNPLTRSYESNGPDVKIRGTAQQIAEKYTTLARDAQSSGDRVMAENYLQHAEHYNRIIAAAQAQMPNQQPRPRDDEDDEDEDREMQPGFGGGEQPSQSFNGNGAHPRNDQPRGDRGEQPRNEQRNDRGDRNEQSRHEQARAEQEPQPVIEGTPAEVALEQGELDTGSGGAQANGPAQEAADGEQPPRRARRPRRPRNRTEGEGESQPADEPVPAA